MRQNAAEFVTDTGFTTDQITRLQRENVALKEHLAALRRSNSDLEQFAWSASHDLKEPLRTITSYTQLLLRRMPSAPGSDEGEFAGYIIQGVERMHAMIDGLLVYARAGQGPSSHEDWGTGTEPELAEEPVDTSTVAAEAVQSLQGLMEECRASVSIAPLPPVAVPPTLLLQIFSNLIGNALKYRTEDAAPRIEILETAIAAPEGEGGSQRQEMAVIAVRDNGIGIDSEYHDRIFGPFHRLHGEEYPGIGLGLAITRRLVRRYGGEIWVESEAGRGSTFYFTLPAAKAQVAAHATGTL